MNGNDQCLRSETVSVPVTYVSLSYRYTIGFFLEYIVVQLLLQACTVRYEQSTGQLSHYMLLIKSISNGHIHSRPDDD